jgi:hypothetical protein
LCDDDAVSEPNHGASYFSTVFHILSNLRFLHPGGFYRDHPSRKPFPSANLTPTVSTVSTLPRPFE